MWVAPESTKKSIAGRSSRSAASGSEASGSTSAVESAR